MKLKLIDLRIILAYLLATLTVGLILRKKAKRNHLNYLLGGTTLPWYLFGPVMHRICMTFLGRCGWVAYVLY